MGSGQLLTPRWLAQLPAEPSAGEGGRAHLEDISARATAERGSGKGEVPVCARGARREREREAVPQGTPSCFSSPSFEPFSRGSRPHTPPHPPPQTPLNQPLTTPPTSPLFSCPRPPAPPAPPSRSPPAPPSPSRLKLPPIQPPRIQPPLIQPSRPSRLRPTEPLSLAVSPRQGAPSVCRKTPPLFQGPWSISKLPGATRLHSLVNEESGPG